MLYQTYFLLKGVFCRRKKKFTPVTLSNCQLHMQLHVTNLFKMFLETRLLNWRKPKDECNKTKLLLKFTSPLKKNFYL